MTTQEEKQEYPVLLAGFEKPVREALAIGWGEDTTTLPTPQHVAMLAFELELTQLELAQAKRVIQILTASATSIAELLPC